MKESEVELDVCQAIQTLNQRAEEKGIKIGREIGREIGQEIGRETGRIDMLAQNIKKLIKNMGWTAEQAMDVLDVSESDREKIASKKW